MSNDIILTQKALGPLELEIMTIMWRDDYRTVRQVYEEIRRARSIAYTTVMTTMQRLAEKGILITADEGGRGHAYFYTPAFDRRAFILLAVQQVLADLAADEGERRQIGEVIAGMKGTRIGAGRL